MPNNIFISAGDFSGDIHAANLVSALKRIEPDIYITSIGGVKLQKCSNNFLDNIVNLNAFGFWSPLKLYFKLRQIFNDKLKKSWDKTKPDKVILVDYYGFNIYVAKEAFKRKIPVYYYISPQVWATRPGRIKKLAKYVKKMLVIFPFEEKIYTQSGVDAKFVGHPLIDMVPENNYDPDKKKPVIGLFPGSRKNVFNRHLPVLQKTAELILQEIQCEIKIFTINQLFPFCADSKYEIIDGENFLERKKVTFAITTSGTVSLENALLGIPMIVFYKLSRFNYFLAKILTNIKYITMVNILSDQEIVKEFIQDDAVPEKLAAEAVRMLKNRSNLKNANQQLLKFRKELGHNGVSDRAAQIILQ